MRTRIKICGVRDIATAHAAARAGADAVGLVFVERSPRYVTLDAAARIVASLPAMVEPVGLFADAPVETVCSTVQAAGLSSVQLHGEEAPAYVQRLQSCMIETAGRRLRIIKAMAFDSEQGSVRNRLAPWRAAGEGARPAAILWDAPPTQDTGLTGGGGSGFDWEPLAVDLAASADDAAPPTIIAGGLTPDNVAACIATFRPWAVDVSSGVESSRGLKESHLMDAFCEAVRHADAASLSNPSRPDDHPATQAGF